MAEEAPMTKMCHAPLIHLLVDYHSQKNTENDQISFLKLFIKVKIT